MKNQIGQLPRWIVSRHVVHLFAFLALPIACVAQVNTGSNGSDGPLNPTVNTVINMALRPNGIYQYTSVNIPANVTVTFTPNANNTPVTWLVQGNVVIAGAVNVSGQYGNGNTPGAGGPGGGAGGAGGVGASPLPHRGAGMGGGDPGQSGTKWVGGNGSYATAGGVIANAQAAAGLTYGNKYLLPLAGGSGGGGSMPPNSSRGGGGGGGAILIASNGSIRVDGDVVADGGSNQGAMAGGGSGGGIRLVAAQILGQGSLWTGPGVVNGVWAGYGYVRLDVLDDQFVGTLSPPASRGFNPILIAPANQNVSLAIQSVAGNVVPANPTGVLATPDVTIPGQQANPIPIVFQCVNIPLNTPITVVVTPVNGPLVTATAMNNTGTLASSSGTVSLSLPRGGGAIYATAVVPVGGGQASTSDGMNAGSFAQTGLTTDGERFTKIEITAGLGGRGEIAWITSSGKRFLLPGN